MSDWQTTITRTGAGELRVRGYDICAMIGQLSFAQAVFLILKGELPSAAEARMMEGLLVSSIDHGITPPSNLAARTVLSGGNPLNAAVAAGILTIGDSHGGAIEQCAKILQQAVAAGEDAAAVAARFRATGARIPGYGHRVHARDPRSSALLELADQCGFTGPHIRLAAALMEELERHAGGRKLPLNVDGAIAAVISEMGFDWRLGKGFFIIARTPGLVAHVFEEWSTQKPMRKLGPIGGEYAGPADRELPAAE
jgi:citryl-CoA lyase